MYMMAVRVSLAGAPLVSRNDWPNMLAEARIVTVVTNAMTGRRPGAVTWRNSSHLDAPSTRAASYSSGEISCRPARKMTALNPSVHHTVMPISEIHAHGTSVVHGIAWPR